jgi:hypothetical protein
VTQIAVPSAIPSVGIRAAATFRVIPERLRLIGKTPQATPSLRLLTMPAWQAADSAGSEKMTPRGFLTDEDPAHGLAIMTRVAARPANIRKMAWLMPRVAKAVPYLGYVLVASQKPR